MARKGTGNKMYGYGYKPPVKSKYNARKAEVGGVMFDSKKEAARYLELKALEDAGEITELELQKEFELIPAMREPDTTGSRGGKIRGKVVERKVVYRADFTYKDKAGNLVVEDVKGCRFGGAYNLYKIKRKLLLWRYGISIKEI